MKVNELTPAPGVYESTGAQLIARATPLRAPEMERLRAALAFYAAPDTYHIDILGACGLGEDEDDAGFGARARAALACLEPRNVVPAGCTDPESLDNTVGGEVRS